MRGLTPEDLQPRINWTIAEINPDGLKPKKYCNACTFMHRGSKFIATVKLTCIDKSSKIYGKPLTLCLQHYQELVDAGEVLGA
jgi:hypothetical protein